MAKGNRSETLWVEKERTKRYFGLLIAGGIVAVLALLLFFLVFKPGSGGKGEIEITTKGIKINLEQPIINQVDTSSATLRIEGKPIRITKGTIPKQTIESVPVLDSSVNSVSRFYGHNFIDVQGGYVVASDNVDWKVQHDTLGYVSSDFPMLTLTSAVNAKVTAVVVSRKPVELFVGCNDIQCFADKVAMEYQRNNLVIDKAGSWYDSPSNTAFISLTNVQRDHVYIKLVIANGYCYRAVAQIAGVPGSKEFIQANAVAMVASFAVIGK